MSWKNLNPLFPATKPKGCSIFHNLPVKFDQLPVTSESELLRVKLSRKQFPVGYRYSQTSGTITVMLHRSLLLVPESQGFGALALRNWV